jgi:V8-like Glu-specific endopeptidase
MRASLFSWSVSVMLWALSVSAQAAPAIEGLVVPIDKKQANVAGAGSGVAWTAEIGLPDNFGFFRLHFTEIEAAGEGDFSIILKNSAGKVMSTVSRDELVVGSDYWSDYLSGSYALVELHMAPGSKAAAVKFKIVEAGIEAAGARLQSRASEADPQDLPLRFFKHNEPLLKAALAVAKIRYTRNNFLYTCTGFLITDDLLLTNQHCIDSDAICKTTVAQFGYWQDDQFEVHKGEDFRCIALNASDPTLDFALLKLSKSPGKKWGKLSWQWADSPLDTALFLIQHPGGEPQRVAHKGCSVTRASAVGSWAGIETDFGHKCDTETGSSGSPALDDQFRVVGLHHLGFDKASQEWSKQNRAVRASQLKERLAPFLVSLP